MNHLSHRIALPHNTTFNQMLFRSLCMQIFGHEAKVEKDIVDETRCSYFNVIVYRLINIKSTHLAWRKLLNPVKYIEFLLMFILTLPLWSLLRSQYLALDYLEETIDKPSIKTHLCRAFILLMQFVLYPPLLFLHEMISALFRTPLAPARLIVRPIINFMKDHPNQFILFSMLSLISSCALFTLVSAQILLSVSSFFLTNLLLAKTSIYLSEIIDAYKVRQSDEDAPFSAPKSKKTTAKITNALHGIDPKKVEVREVNNQDFTYSLALFTGTERLFYAKKTTQPNQAKDATHLKYYQRSLA